MLKSAPRAATSAFFLSVILALSTTVCFAFDTPQYDKRIEAAATEIVANKMGLIRGSVDAAPWVAEHGVDEMVTGYVPTDKPAANTQVRFAQLMPSQAAAAHPMTRRAVRKISSFLYF